MEFESIQQKLPEPHTFPPTPGFEFIYESTQINISSNNKDKTTETNDQDEITDDDILNSKFVSHHSDNPRINTLSDTSNRLNHSLDNEDSNSATSESNADNHC